MSESQRKTSQVKRHLLGLTAQNVLFRYFLLRHLCQVPTQHNIMTLPRLQQKAVLGLEKEVKKVKKSGQMLTRNHVFLRKSLVSLNTLTPWGGGC